MAKLRTVDLTVGYQKQKIVQHLTIEIPEGQIIGLIGPNGSGKSTLLKALARVLTPLSGDVFLDEKQLHQIKTKEVAGRIALLSQSVILPSACRFAKLSPMVATRIKKGSAVYPKKTLKRLSGHCRRLDLRHWPTKISGRCQAVKNSEYGSRWR